MKKNIGATLALYPCPVIVVGAMVNEKPTWTLLRIQQQLEQQKPALSPAFCCME